MRVHWPDNFEELYKERGSQKYGIRLLALWKIQSGMTETAVCQFLRKTHKTIHQWRCLYERGGVEALLSIKPGRGRKARLRDSHCFEQSLEALSQERQGGRLRCQDIVEMVKQRYDIEYSRPGMYHALHRLGFSWITARSKHPQHNPEEQESFKKTL